MQQSCKTLKNHIRSPEFYNKDIRILRKLYKSSEYETKWTNNIYINIIMIDNTLMGMHQFFGIRSWFSFFTLFSVNKRLTYLVLGYFWLVFLNQVISFFQIFYSFFCRYFNVTSLFSKYMIRSLSVLKQII